MRLSCTWPMTKSLMVGLLALGISCATARSGSGSSTCTLGTLPTEEAGERWRLGCLGDSGQLMAVSCSPPPGSLEGTIYWAGPKRSVSLGLESESAVSKTYLRRL